MFDTFSKDFWPGIFRLARNPGIIRSRRFTACARDPLQVLV